VIGRISGRTSVYLYDTSVYVNDIQDVHQYTYTYIRTYISKPIRYISMPKRYIRTYISIPILISGRTSIYLYLYQDVHQYTSVYLYSYQDHIRIPTVFRTYTRIRTYISIPILISGRTSVNLYDTSVYLYLYQDVHQYTSVYLNDISGRTYLYQNLYQDVHQYTCTYIRTYISIHQYT